MANMVILGALVVVPVVLILALRANAAITFMGLCVGSVLVTYTSSDVITVASGLSSHPGVITTRWVQLALLVVPFLLTLLFTRRSVRGSKQLFNLLPAISCGLLLVLLIVPLFSASLQYSLESQSAWHQLDSLQTAVVLGGALLSLAFLLSAHRAMRRAEDKHSRSA